MSASEQGDPADLLGIDEAAELLGITVEQVEAMVAGRLLVPEESDGDGPAFSRAAVIAVKHVGG